MMNTPQDLYHTNQVLLSNNSLGADIILKSTLVNQNVDMPAVESRGPAEMMVQLLSSRGRCNKVGG